MTVTISRRGVLLLVHSAPRGENGKPITEVPNVKVSNPKSGRIKSSYFSVSGYTTIDDPYMDPSRKELQYELEKKKKILYKD